MSGPFSSANETGKAGTVVVRQPEALNGTQPPRVTVGTLAEVTKVLDVSRSTQQTTLFLVPRDQAENAGWARGNTMCILGENRYVWDGLITHEYVHTRQEFSLAPGMEWFTEASAFYYMAIVPYQRGTMDDTRALDRLSSNVNRSLTESDQYGVYADRGSAVLAALDLELRNRTEGNRTLEHVFRAMNSHEGTITYNDFEDIVAEVAGERMDGWLDAHVAGNDPVNITLEDLDELTLTTDAADGQFDLVVAEGPTVPTTQQDRRFRLDVRENTTQSLEVSVLNEGLVRDRQLIRFVVTNASQRGTVLAAKNASLAIGRSQTVSFSSDRMRTLAPGTYEVSVTSEDGRVNGTLRIHDSVTSEGTAETSQSGESTVQRTPSGLGPIETPERGWRAHVPENPWVQLFWIGMAITVFCTGLVGLLRS